MASNRKMLQMLLKKLDLPSDTAEDGLVAVDRVLADVGKYRVVFMDNLMPNMVRMLACLADLTCSNLLCHVVFRME